MLKKKSKGRKGSAKVGPVNRPEQIDDRWFLRAWFEAVKRGDSLTEFAKAHGLTISWVTSRTTRIRSIGVNLPFLEGQKPETKWRDELNAIIETIRNVEQ